MLPLTKEDKYLPVCASPTTLLIVHAKNRIAIAPNIDLMPAIHAFPYSGKETWRSRIINNVDIATALEPPTTSEIPTVVFSNAPKRLNGFPSAAKASLPV